jgi:virulence factor Mce-like protein
VKRNRGALSASPVLVGAVTVLITVVAVFISYAANQGLPFVETYQISAELPSGEKLVEGNEVRAGGFRVGQVTKIRPGRIEVDGRTRSIAVLQLELDERLDPLPRDTRISVRSRSALGLKYVELVQGTSTEGLQAGDTIPLRRTEPAPDLEDVLATFDADTRDDARRTLQGFGDGLAGRGRSVNRAIEELRPFLAALQPVMRTLSDPDTELGGLFPALEQTLMQAAPVAAVQAQWIASMADTFAAIGRDPRALQETIEESPPTLDAAIDSFRVQTPFLARVADLSRRLQPGAAQLERALPRLNDALLAGIPAFRRTPELGRRTEQLFRAVEDLGDDPSTLLALRDLSSAARIARPAVEFVAPYQTVCNYLNYFINPLGTHQSAAVPGGTAQRILAKQFLTSTQLNNLGTTQSRRPADIPVEQDPQEPEGEAGEFPHVLHSQQYAPAVDARGRADCQDGQAGYLNRLVTDGRYPPDRAAGGFLGGGSHVVLDSNTPGLAGGTYKARELGIDSLEDLP